MKQFIKELTILIPKKVIGLFLILIVAILITKLGQKVVVKILAHNQTETEKQKRKTIILLFQNIIKYVVIILALVIGLEIYGVDTKSFLAGLGIVGLVLGLALQDFLKDVIMGITILTENYFVVGDIITINGFTGQIVNFGLRTTKIRNEAGDEYILANRNIISLVNVRPKASNFAIEVPTAYSEPETKVTKVLTEVLQIIIKQTPATVRSKLLGMTEYRDNCVIYTLQLNCAKDKQPEVRSYALKVIKAAYEKYNIKMRG